MTPFTANQVWTIIKQGFNPQGTLLVRDNLAIDFKNKILFKGEEQISLNNKSFKYTVSQIKEICQSL